MTEKGCIDMIKDKLSAITYFGLSSEKYLHEIEEIYGKNFQSAVKELFGEIQEKFPQIPKETVEKVVREVYCSGLKNLNIQLEQLEFVAANRFFQIPSYVKTELNQVLNEASAAFSEEKNIELDARIKQSVLNIKSKRAYIDLLQNQLNKLKEINRILD